MVLYSVINNEMSKWFVFTVLVSSMNNWRSTSDRSMLKEGE